MVALLSSNISKHTMYIQYTTNNMNSLETSSLQVSSNTSLHSLPNEYDFYSMKEHCSEHILQVPH